MSFFQHQSEVVERYLDALRCDPHAVPPQDLDPDTARIIRAIVSVHSLSPTSTSTELLWEVPNTHDALDAAEQRVWDRLMFAVLAPSELEPTYLSDLTIAHRQPAPVATKEAATSVIADNTPLPIPAIFPTTSIYAPAMPSLPLVQRKQKLDFSFIAGMLMAVFLITGLLVQHDALTGDTLRYSTPSNVEMTIPTLDHAITDDDNPELFVRYQPAETLWAGLPVKSRSKVEVSAVTSGVPISPNKRFPE